MVAAVIQIQIILNGAFHVNSQAIYSRVTFKRMTEEKNRLN